MDDAELARLIHLNMVEAFASLPAYQPSGFVRRAGGVVVAASGSPLSFFNEIISVEDHPDPEALAEAVQAVRDAGLASVAHLRAGVDNALVPVIRALGFEEVAEAFYPAMVLTQLPPALDLPAGFEVQRVGDREGFDLHLRTAAAVAGAEPDLFATWLGPGLIEDPAVSLFVGHADGMPVAMSMSVLTGDVVGIYNVGTVEAARRRGYGWAMTLAAIMSGVRDGSKFAALQSSEMGFPLYAAHGFRTLFDYRRFRDPGPPGAWP